MTFAELEDKRNEVLAIAKRHGARNVRVFGSVARGEAVTSSDVDLLVEFEQGRSLVDHVAMVRELEELLGAHVDVAHPRGLHRLIRDKILQEAQPI